MKTIILCGGSGTRLWPISQSYRPKQFVKLIKNQSLFELTVQRNKAMSDEFIIVVNSQQTQLCNEQIGKIKSKILIESIGRNTAPAIALACLNTAPDDIVLIVPSDHLILNQEEYEKCLKYAQKLACEDKLVTFGIKPTHPETGYGYIQADGEKVISFKEKPNLETAIDYIQDGNYSWNSGMFCFKAGVFLKELREHSPEIFIACTKVNEKYNSSSPKEFSKEDLMTIPSDSIDYAVMEKSSNVSVIKSDIGWSDLGSYDSLFENTEKINSNAIISNSAKVITHESNNNLIIGHEKTIATFCVDELIIVDSPEGILIGKKGRSQEVKTIYNSLKSAT